VIASSPTLPSCFEGVPLLRDRPIAPGERWIYSAGFNVEPDLVSTSRIDCELNDLDQLSAAGARIAILAHQGSHREGTARHLDFVAEYLERRLGRSIAYLPDPLVPETLSGLERLEYGAISVVGNTRLLSGEEAGDPGLACLLARLGDSVAIGGFSKAHRAHASNVGLLRHLPGYAASSLVEELTGLVPWGGTEEGRLSVAALGGLKREKIDPGLTGLAQHYDVVIPGGAVLNALLATFGYEIGASHVGECMDAADAAAELVRRDCRAEVHFPEEVVVAPVGDLHPGAARTIRVDQGVPAGHAIVDFEIRPATADRIRCLVGGRALIAGPPGLCAVGFQRASAPLLEAMAQPGVDGLLLGGDTTRELSWDGPVSAGGGSALLFLATGECPVLTALSDQRHP
jgi:phosphoglycerate kinase